MNWNPKDIERFRDRIVKPGSKYNVIDDTLLKKVKGKMKHEESNLQIRCVKTFGLLYPKYAKRLRSIPNERESNWQKFLAMGMLPGSLDLELLLKRGCYGSMQIEFKTDKGRLSNEQIAFIQEVQYEHYCCVVRSVEQFLMEVKNYLNNA